MVVENATSSSAATVAWWESCRSLVPVTLSSSGLQEAPEVNTTLLKDDAFEAGPFRVTRGSGQDYVTHLGWFGLEPSDLVGRGGAPVYA